jgi:fructose-bisphosphate aldolase class II
MEKTLRQCLSDAQAGNFALGHFNVSNIEGFWAVVRAAQNTGKPVIVGVSEGERDFIGVRQARALVSSVRDEFQVPIFLNADHTYSFDRVKEAIDAGFDSVIFDGAKLSFEENLKETKKCVEYARSVNPEILVEAELGYIGQSSKVLDEIPEGASLSEETLTKPEEAAQFVKETGIDMLAPAVGTLHGILRSGVNPEINIERIKAIKKAVKVPLVLHGGSGSTSSDFEKAVKAGISIIHISTEIRIAFRDALKKDLQENPDEVAPYKIMKGAVQAMQKIVEDRIRLFSGE